MGDIREGPKAAERMESELFGRLAVHTETDFCDEAKVVCRCRARLADECNFGSQMNTYLYLSSLSAIARMHPKMLGSEGMFVTLPLEPGSIWIGMGSCRCQHSG